LLDRGFARAVRLEIHDTCPRSLGHFLLEHFELTEDDMYRVNGPVNLNRVGVVYDMVDRPDLKYRPFSPRVQAPKPGANAFDMVRERDVLLHHPYDSFSTVIDCSSRPLPIRTCWRSSRRCTAPGAARCWSTT
jgi:polyphosphate kinase